MAIDKVVDSTILDGYFEDIADAIRAKDGSQATLAPAAMAQAIANIPTGGGDAGLTALLDGTATGSVTIQSENLDNMTYNLRSITELHAPNLLDWSEMGSNSDFSRLVCQYGGIMGQANNTLQVIDLPKCKRLNFTSYSTLNRNTPKKLQTMNLPELETGTFYIEGQSNTIIPMTSLSLPKLQGAWLMIQYTNLQTVSLPIVTDLYCNLSYNAQLTELTLPMATTGKMAFQGCRAMTKFVAPNLTMTLQNNSCFVNTSSLDYVDLKGFTGNANSMFNGSSCTALILRSDTMVTLSNANTFNNSTFAAGTGYFYVPRDLISTYQAATNWATYANQFRSLEDYTVDGTVTGALDPTKI